MSITRFISTRLSVAGLCCAVACATELKSVDAGNPQAPTGSNAGAVAAAGTGGSGTAAATGGAPALSNGSGGNGAVGVAGMNAGGVGGTGGASVTPTDAGTDPGDAKLPDEPVTCPATVMAPGDTDGTVMVGGTMREYILHVPANYTGTTPVPLVTDWHPILSDFNYEKANSGYQQKADAEGFIVVWPNGIGNAWNVGPCCTMDRAVDDVAFARAMIDQITTTACIDPKRIYAVGYSMGGGMSYKLACDAADIIAAVAPAAFQLMEENEWPCQPSRPITVHSFNGTNDFVVPYAGGASTPPNGLNVTNHFLGAQGTFTKWAELDGCTGMPTVNGECSTYAQCKDGVEVTLCLKQGGGHDTGDPDVAWNALKKYTLP